MIYEKNNSLLCEKYYKINHKSGLDIYIVPKDLSSSYAIFGTRYGSTDYRFKKGENSEFTVVPDGIAHFLEHKMFENEDGVDTFARFAKFGGNANAYTSFNMTAYLFSATNDIYDNLETLLDYVTHPYFTPETVAKEQGIIGQEIKMGEDNPGRALIFDMLKSMYKSNPVRIDIAGTVDSISHITSDLLYECYNTFYNLNNMALCLCGKFEPEKVIETADRILKKAEPFSVVSEAEKEPDEVIRKRSSLKMEVSEPMFSIGIKDNKISTEPLLRAKKGVACAIISDMLFGPSSEFFNENYYNGTLSGTIDIWTEHCKAYSFISFAGEAKNPEVVYDLFIKLIDKNKKNGLNREDFERSKRVSYANFIKSFDSTEEIANNMLGCVLEGYDIFDMTDIISEIDYEYVNELFLDMFRDEYYTMSTVLPLNSEG